MLTEPFPKLACVPRTQPQPCSMLEQLLLMPLQEFLGGPYKPQGQTSSRIPQGRHIPRSPVGRVVRGESKAFFKGPQKL